MIQATNGDNLISVGTKGRGMGGIGIAFSHGAESILSNPALITTIEGTEFSFGGIVFMPEISAEIYSNALPSQNLYTSESGTNIIPEISIGHKINDDLYIGFGIWGTAGMGIDYTNIPTDLSQGKLGNFNMLTSVQILQFGLPIAYKHKGLSVSISPILQYANIDIHYDATAMGGGPVGAELEEDFAVGFNMGIVYEMDNGLKVGGIYKSPIKMNYDKQLSTAMAGFGIIGFSDILEQPAEYGLGISYSLGKHTIGFDYKNILWSKSKGYGDFGWKDQNLYALGYQFDQENWALRVGYNYVSSAVVESENHLFNMLNLLGFPATSEHHFTLGGTYDLTENFSADIAYVNQINNTQNYNISNLFGGAPSSVKTNHKENSISAQINYLY